MTQPTQPKPKLDPVRLAALLDAATVGIGIAAVAAGATILRGGAWGLIAFGSLLLGAEVVAPLIRRTS